MDQTLLVVLQIAFGSGLLAAILRIAYSLGQYSSRISTIEEKLAEVDKKINTLQEMIQDLGNDFTTFKIDVARMQVKQLHG